MTLEGPNVLQVEPLLMIIGELEFFLAKLRLKNGDLFAHLLHLVGDTVGGLSHNLVDVHLGADALRLAAEVEGLQRLLQVRMQLRYAADYGRLGPTTEGVLQDTGQLAVTKVDVVVLGVHLLALREAVDDVAEGE